MRNKILLQDENIEVQTAEIVKKVCEKYGLDADDYLHTKELNILDHVNHMLIEARQKLSLARMVCADPDFVSNEFYLALEELKGVVLESGTLIDAADDMIAGIV